MFQFESEESHVDIVTVTKEETWEGQVGDLVVVDKSSFGTVRYIGPVNPHPGIWLGVEWENVSRGKHDGQSYFKCSVPGNAGSFVRPRKVTRVKSLMEALTCKYFADLSDIKRINVQQVGDNLLKIQLRDRKVIDLGDHAIAKLGEPNDLAKMCPNLISLNLGSNFVTSWTSVIDLCSHLIGLKQLNLSNNPMQFCTDEDISSKVPLTYLNHVILGSINYDWNDFLRISTWWPNVTDFQVPFNNISNLSSSPIIALQNVSRLDMEGNKISSWDEVLKLSVLTSLTYINLCGNQLPSVHFPKEGDSFSTPFFLNLCSINLSDNRISNWMSFNELSKLCKLDELRVSGNPVFEVDAPATNRQIIIARIPQLRKLEGVSISSRERRDSELDYVKRFAIQWKQQQNQPEFLKEHPLYAVFVQKYGAEEADQSKVMTMKSDLIFLNLIPMKDNAAPIQKEFLSSMTVKKLKVLIWRLFKCPGSNLQLTAVSAKNSGITFILDNDMYTLSQFSLENNDSIYILRV